MLLLRLGVSTLTLTQYKSFSNLTHVAVDKTSGKVFLGGVNLVAALDKDLQNPVTDSIGPQFDSNRCFKSPAPCSVSKEYVDNTVTILEINPIHKYALICGSIWQGLCSAYNLSDIKTKKEFNSTSHASFIGSKASSVAFFGLHQKDVTANALLLYAAVASYDRTEEMFSPYTISTREITYSSTDHSIHYLKQGHSYNDNSYLNVSPAVRKNFQVRYLYGFEHDGYGYYVAIQPLDKDIARTKYLTKLIQFCQDDDHYWTYIEVPVHCSRNDVNYTLATAAYLTTDGLSDQLTVSFGRHGNRPAWEPEPKYGSVVCNFSMQEARDLFVKIRKRCSNGGAGSYPWWIYGTERSCQISPVVSTIVTLIIQTDRPEQTM